jgi:hypothetical protein
VIESVGSVRRTLRRLRSKDKRQDKKMQKLFEASLQHKRRLKHLGMTTSGIKSDVTSALSSWKEELEHSAAAAKASLV